MLKMQIFLIGLISALLLTMWGCEDPAETAENAQSVENTLEDNSLSNDGHYDSYFYDFTKDFDVKFYRYDKISLEYSGLFNPDEDTLNFKNFKNYLLTIDPDDDTNREWITCQLADTLNEIPILEELLELYPNISDSEVLDSLINEYENQGFAEMVHYDTISVISQPFKNVESLVWNEYNEIDVQFQNYSIKNTGYILDTVFVPHEDVITNKFYKTDLIGSEGSSVYIDTTEWIDQTHEYSEGSDTLYANFVFSRTTLSSDSLIYRINTDCNDNGIWNSSEDLIQDYNGDEDYEDIVFEFQDINDNGVFDSLEIKLSDYNSDGDSTDVLFEWVDLGNGLWDDAEPYVDLDENGENPLHGFQDRNCNGTWEDAEEIVDEGTEGAIYDENHGVWFIDRGNGMMDGDEVFTEITNDGVISYDELFKFGKISKNLLVSWEDPDSPRILEDVYPSELFEDENGDGIYNVGEEFDDLNSNETFDANGDSIVARWPDLNGDPIVFNDIIDRYIFEINSRKYVTNLDSMVMVWSHPIVGDIEGSDDGDYSITKTKWEYEHPTQGFTREYDYHFFKKNEHVYQRVFPSYFIPYGFHGYSTVGQEAPGPLEDGFWFDSTRFVDQVLYYTPGHYFRNGERVETSEEVITPVADYHVGHSYAVDRENVSLQTTGREFPADSTLKITREVSMIMLGTGVEYIERNETWLVEGLGIVKDLVSFHWTDPPEWLGIEGEGWVEYSLLELADYREYNSSQRLMFGNRRITHPSDLNTIDEFQEDPFKYKRTVGLQRIEFPVNN